ncbi:MAG: pyridoxal phosphate-dependent aminotransferase [Deltaproteobacteria bacterium]|nr:pyridoxal phosphate-dependent aminotransferase [Deltaproteobacteria bacterium]
MSLKVSKRRELVAQSEIRSMSIECDRVDGINLSQGVCDTEIPIIVRQGAHAAMENGINTYTRYDGLAELRSAIAAKQERFTGMKVDSEREVIVSAGATGALLCTCLALLNPGDEVIVFEPFYGYHISTMETTQAVPVYIKTDPPEWKFSYEDLEKKRTGKTRAILVSTPSNPSGKVFSSNELDMIATFASEHDLFVITDEIYEHFIYDGLRHIAPATLPGMKNRTITISGVSKTYSITGWRVGYCICDAEWAETIGYFNDLIYVCAPAPLQMGVAEGLLNIGGEYYENLARDYERKRDKICDALSRAGLEPYIPQGAYYVLADISGVSGATGKDKAMTLLYETKIACVPGEAFFQNGGGETLGRFCFAKDDEVLEEACRRLIKLRT